MRSRISPEAADAPSEPGNAGSTLDAFHRGDFWLVQPARGAHRAGTDAMMLAAAVPGSFGGRLADLGAGAGAAGLAVASRCKAAHIVLVERSAEMAACARATLDHPGNAHLRSRAELVEADVTLAGNARIAAGLADQSFDFVILNPPFNTRRHRESPDGLRREAHVMQDATFEAWLRTAAAIARPRGGVALIARPSSLRDILDALAGRFGGAEIVPVLPRAEAKAIRIVVRAVRGSRADLSLMPPLILHDGSAHSFGVRADAINNGRASLFSD